MFVGSGCGTIKYFSARDDMIQHLNEKYKQEFVADIVNASNMVDDKIDDMLCYVKGSDPRHNSVFAERKRVNGKYVYTDTWFSLFIRGDLEREIQEICEQYSLHVKVYYNAIDVFGEEFDYTKSYADYKNSGKYLKGPIEVVIEDVYGMDQKKIIDALVSEFGRQKLKGKYHFTFVPDDVMSQMDRTDYYMTIMEAGYSRVKMHVE
jgi:hypothetical protein